MTVETFGEWLKQRRRQLDMTQQELADGSGCSVGTIQKIEQGIRRPSKQLAELMAAQLAIPAAQEEAFITFARTEPYTADVTAAQAILNGEAAPPPPALPETTIPEPQFEPLPGVEQPGFVPHNLPLQATPFIGREQELASLNHLIADPNIRLVTIIGAGGMGKTRLALAVAAQFVRNASFSHGVFFVNLASLDETRHIAPALAEAIGYQLTGKDNAVRQTQLLNYLRPKKMLLVFDNFEHLLDGATLLVDLLQSAPEINILVTSRERLHLRLEQVYPIKGLEIPDEKGVVFDFDDADAAQRYTAVQLFLQSARRNMPDFALDNEDDLNSLTRICHIVAGMPLALELAASWVDVLPLAEIAAELQHALEILGVDRRDMPERHRSVRVAIDHSWQRLDEQERAVFARLSRFRGGFTREAAQSVAGANLRTLARLVSKSLLDSDGQGGRYQIHELLRQYGAEKLEALNEKEALRERHGRYYADFLHARLPDLKGHRQLEVAREIAADIDNIRAAWQWAIGQGAETEIAKSWETLFWYYERLFHNFIEGEAILQQAVGMLNRTPVEGAGKLSALERQILLEQLRAGLSVFLFYQGKLSEAMALIQQSVAKLRHIGRDAEKALALALAWYSGIRSSKGEYTAAIQNVNESLAIFTEVGDRYGQILCHQGLGYFAEIQGFYTEAWAPYRRSIEICQQIGEEVHKLLSINGLGRVALALGDYKEAKKQLETSLQFRRENGDRFGQAGSLVALGELALVEGNLAQADAYFQESRQLSKDLNLPHDLELALNGLGSVARLRGAFGPAEQFYQESLALLKMEGNPRDIAVTLNRLGQLALDQKAYAQAEQLHQESLAIFQQIENKHGLASTWRFLGHVAVAQGKAEYAQAWECFWQALALANQTKTSPVALDVLRGCAALLLSDETNEAGQEKALALLMFVQDHPASEFETKEKATSWLIKIEGERKVANKELFDEQLHGRTLDVWKTAESLRQELSHGNGEKALGE